MRNYPDGSKIRNFTYDGFADDLDDNRYGYDIKDDADKIDWGKHGVYEYDFGFGPEVLEYALKMDSKGQIIFKAAHDGKIVIAIASQNVGSGLKVNGNHLITVQKAYTLQVVQMDVRAETTYTFTRTTSECGIYYLGYLPGDVSSMSHSHAYYTTTTATCTQNGETSYICLVCGQSKKENTNAFGHEMVDDAAYDATCTTQGKTAGRHCVRCDYVQTKQETKDALGHSYVNGFCTRCHLPNNNYTNNVSHKIDFTTDNANDYGLFGSYFKDSGICELDSSYDYLVMKTNENGEYAYIEFTVTGPVTLIVVASSTDRGNTSEFTLVDANNQIITEYFGETEVEGVHESALVYRITAEGTYRFVCTETGRVGRVMSMSISTTALPNR